MSRLSTVLPTGDWWSGPCYGQRSGIWISNPAGFSPLRNQLKWDEMDVHGEPQSQDVFLFPLLKTVLVDIPRGFLEVWDYAALLFQVNLTALQKQSSTAGSFKKDRVKFSLEPSRDASLLVFLVILIDFVWSCFFGCTMEKDAASHHGDLIRQCLIKNCSASGSRS